MATNKRTNIKTVEGLLKAALVLSRTVDFVLETHVVESAVSHALSPSKVQILRLLGRRGPQMPSQVAKFLGVTKSAVTQIVDSMVRDKLLTRRTAQADRREVNIQLTKKGRDLYLAVTRAQRHCVRNMLRQIADQDAERWIETLNEVSSALGRAEHAFKHFCAQCGAHKDGRCVLVDGPADCRMALSAKKAASRKKSVSSKRASKSASSRR
jgi:DNA-binding MarR family transcriptional regulator